MPNHIQNKLQIIGPEKRVAEVFNAIAGVYDDGEKMRIDFNKIKPMPESLNVQMHSVIETAVKVALKMPLHNNSLIAMLEVGNRDKSRSPLELKDEDWQLFIQALNNVRLYGFIYWYDWCVENWGTKWNAYAQGDKRNSADTIYFQTAWSSPVDLFAELSKHFPDVTFKLTYADEDTGSNTGRFTFIGGVAIESFQPESQSPFGYEIYFELHPDARKYYKIVNGKYEYDEEAA